MYSSYSALDLRIVNSNVEYFIGFVWCLFLWYYKWYAKIIELFFFLSFQTITGAMSTLTPPIPLEKPENKARVDYIQVSGYRYIFICKKINWKCLFVISNYQLFTKCKKIWIKYFVCLSTCLFVPTNLWEDYWRDYHWQVIGSWWSKEWLRIHFLD